MVEKKALRIEARDSITREYYVLCIKTVGRPLIPWCFQMPRKINWQKFNPCSPNTPEWKIWPKWLVKVAIDNLAPLLLKKKKKTISGWDEGEGRAVSPSFGNQWALYPRFEHFGLMSFMPKSHYSTILANGF